MLSGIGEVTAELLQSIAYFRPMPLLAAQRIVVVCLLRAFQCISASGEPERES